MSREVKKLSLKDWETLLPIRSVRLGQTVLEIRPVGMEELLVIISRFKALQTDGQSLAQVGEGLLKDPRKFVDFIRTYCSDLIPELVGLDGDDFLKLPPAVMIELLDAVVDVNTRGTDIIKNLNALTARISAINQSVEIPSGIAKKNH